MERRDLVFGVIALASCARATKSFEDVLPRQIPGGWERNDLRSLAEIPEIVSRFGADSAVQTTYKGQGSVQLRAFRLRSETTPFELMQKWPLTDGIPAYKGAFFFVAVSQGADPQAVAALLRELQKAAS
jgi:hypothetical protein